MSDNTISIPTWALPLVVSLFVGAISYGAAQANAIVDSLARQEKIQEQTNEQIQALVQALLAK